VAFMLSFSAFDAIGALTPKCPLSFEAVIAFCAVDCYKMGCRPSGVIFQSEEGKPACVCDCPPIHKEENPEIEVRLESPVGG
jgi:hypothetical protein